MPDEALREAKELATDGQLLAKHPDSAGGRNKLIVVGAIEDRDLVSGLKNLFNDFGAQLVVEEDVPSLMEEIRKTAH